MKYRPKVLTTLRCLQTKVANKQKVFYLERILDFRSYSLGTGGIES